jgi:hypothetical protein
LCVDSKELIDGGNLRDGGPIIRMSFHRLEEVPPGSHGLRHQRISAVQTARSF